MKIFVFESEVIAYSTNFQEYLSASKWKEFKLHTVPVRSFNGTSFRIKML